MPAARRRIAWPIALALVAALAYGVARSRRDFVDFEVYRTAGLRAVAAESLYRPDDGHYQFKYWPAFALAMAPLGVLPDELAKLLWYAGSVWLLAVLVRWSVHRLPNRRLTPGVLTAWLLLVTAKFVVKELVNGQINVLFAILVLLSLSALERRRAATAGMLIGLATFVKPYALLFVPWLLAAAGIGAGAGAAAVIAAGLLLPAAVYGWAGNLALLGRWLETVRETTPANALFPENVSFLAMWGKWLGIGPAATALALVTAMGALSVAAIIWRRRSPIERPGFLEAGFLLLLVPLLSPQGWDYVLLIAAPAFACLIDRLGDRSAAWRAVTIAGFALTSLTIFDLVGREIYASLMSASVVSVGAILLGASLLDLRLRRLA